MNDEKPIRNRGNARRGSSGKTAIILTSVLVAVVLLVSVVFLLFRKGSSRFSWAEGTPVGMSSSTSHPGSSSGKPSPYEQQQRPVPHSAPPQAVAPPSADPSANAAAAEPQPPEAGPVVGPPPVFPPMTVPAIHQKAFGRSCSGHLTLTATHLHFECRPADGGSADPGRNVDVPADEVKASDRNGIVLRDGQRYHFTVSSSPGVVMSDAEARAFFQNWVNRIEGRQ